MWLSDYLQKRWGLFCLVGGITLGGLWLFGGGDKKPGRRSSPTADPKGAVKAGDQAPKKLTLPAVTRYCTEGGVAVASPPKANPSAVKHPGFPAPQAPTTTLGPEARGLFPLQRRVAGLGPRRLAHAPLLHRLARGFAKRYRYFMHLATNRRAARRYYRLQAERRKKKGQPPPPGTVDATGRPKLPASAVIALRARGYRRNALRYYDALASQRALKGYKARPAALLELASMLMRPVKRLGPPRVKRNKTPAGPSAASRLKTAAIKVLHQLMEDHPASGETIEALAWLAHRTAARGQCPKVVFLLKKLSTKPLHRHTAGRRLLLRGLAHYLAGRCLLQRSTHAAAATRLHVAVRDGRLAVSRGTPSGAFLAREAAILWARAFGAAGELSKVRERLPWLGPKLVPVAKAVLAAQLLKEGQLRAAMTLCTPSKSAPTGAK